MQEVLFPVSIMCLLILLLIFLLRKFRQPYLVAYIIAGLILGPHVSGVFSDTKDIAALGEIGVLLLMFFLGMEVEIPDKRTLLLKPLIAQGMKMLLSFGLALLMGKWMNWDIGPVFMLTVLLIFNSTAVVSEFLRKNGELYTGTGKTVLNILLLQDILLAPVLTLFQLIDNGNPEIIKLVAAIVGCFLIFFLLRAIRNRNLFQLPAIKAMEEDHELQVFAGIVICLGFALLASSAGLTGSIGSFAAGLLIGQTKALHWLEKVLQPFKVFFVALFFVSVGLMFDISYLKQNYKVILIITLLVMVINSLLSAIVFRLLAYTWKDSMYAGALLSQTGEFGILACSLAWKIGIINIDFFKSSLAVTALSLLVSAIWMNILRKFIYKQELTHIKANRHGNNILHFIEHENKRRL
jgi:CPA2 family monovalent cation:H+ antiporter-2